MVAIGSLVGWWLRGSPPVFALTAATSVAPAKSWRAVARVGHAHCRPRGAHSSRVEEINQELLAAGGGETEAVVSAVAKLIEANQQMQQQLDTAEERSRSRPAWCKRTPPRPAPTR